MKLWYDDIRRAPDNTWEWARTNDEAINILLAASLAQTPFTEASLDHDMGLHFEDPDELDADLRVAPDSWEYEDGMDFVKWMVDARMVPPVVTVHSWNDEAAKDMAYYLYNASKHLNFPCNVTIKRYLSKRERGIYT